MGSSRKSEQIWPLVVLTGAVALGVPFLGGAPDGTGHMRPSHSVPGTSLQIGDELSNEGQRLYGLDGVSLRKPPFQSWWDGTQAAAKLRELNANLVMVESAWQDVESNSAALSALHRAGIRVISTLTSMYDWVDVRQEKRGLVSPVPRTFTPERASKIFAEAQKQRLEQVVDYILIDGDATMYATHAERQQMYALAKSYFPNLPVVRRYSDVGLQRAEVRRGTAHPMGEDWEEYRFGPEECDVALVSVPFGPSTVVVNQVMAVAALINSRSLGSRILISTDLSAMARPGVGARRLGLSEINEFVSAVIGGPSVSGLLLRGIGSEPRDFGSPTYAVERAALKLGPRLPASL